MRHALRLGPRRWGVATLAGVAGVAAALGCARATPAGGASADRAADAPLPDVGVVVENHNTSDVVVTLQDAAGRRIRLGSVASAATRTLHFSGELAAASQSLVLLAHPVGARETYVSERFTLQRGQEVVLTVASRVGQSSVAVR